MPDHVSVIEAVGLSPRLADRLAVSTSQGLQYVPAQVHRAVAKVAVVHASQPGVENDVSSSRPNEQELGVGASRSTCMRFSTNGLENQEFLFSAEPWPFCTDSRGEDIASKHNARSKRAGLVASRGFTSAYPTIAANQLVIDFQIANVGNAVLYLEALYLTIQGQFPVSQTMFWNTWMPFIEPCKLSVTLNPLATFYDLGFSGRLIEISPQTVEHFRLDVGRTTSCADRIFEFRLDAVAHDLNGEKDTISSDRNYHVAFSGRRSDDLAQRD